MSSKTILDRLAIASLNFRYGIKFHFLHHPLCDRFKNHSFSFAGFYICKSCSLLYLGLTLSLLSSLIFDIPLLTHFFLFLASFFIVFLSHPQVYRQLPRWTCLTLRFGLGAVLGWPLLLFVSGYWHLALATIISLYAVKKYYANIRSHLKAKSCEGCPELKNNDVCSGYAKQSNHQNQLAVAIEKIIIK